MTVQPLHSWQPRNLATLGDSPPPEPTLSGVGYPGTLTIVYSEPDACKTWLELIVALEAIRTGRFALWVDFEMDGRSLLARLRDLGATDDDLDKFLYVAPQDQLLDAEIGAYVATLMQEHQPAVVTFDAMAGALALHGLSQDKADDIEYLYSVILRPFRVGDTAVRLIDHVVKDRESRGRWPTGSQRKLGAADVGLSLDVVRPFSRGKNGLAKIRVQKDRLGGLTRPHCTELSLSSNPDTGAITWTFAAAVTDEESSGDVWRPTELMGRVSAYLSQQDGPVPRSSVETHVVGKAKYLRQAMDALIEDGHAKESSGAHSARLIESVSPYSPTSSLVPFSSHVVPDGVLTSSSLSSPPSKGTSGRDEDEDEIERLELLYGDEVA